MAKVFLISGLALSLGLSLIILPSCKSSSDDPSGPRKVEELSFSCTDSAVLPFHGLEARRAPAGVSVKEADDEIKKVCSEAGGTFRPQGHDCLCPGVDVFSYVARACQRLTMKTFETDLPKVCLRAVHPTTDLCFVGERLASMPYSLEQAFGKIALPSFPNQNVSSNWVSTPQDLDDFLKSDLGSYAKNQIFSPSEIAFPHTGARGFLVSLIYYEPDASQIPNLIAGAGLNGDSRAGIPMQLSFRAPSSEVVGDGLSEALKTLPDKMMQGLESHAQTQYEARSVKGCAELCFFSRSWDVLTSSGRFHMTWEKHLASGAVFRNVVLVRNSSGLIDAQILLTPSDTISLVFVYQYDFSNGRVARSTLGFDRLGKYVWKENIEGVLPQFSGAGHQRSGGVVTCEAGFPLDSDSYEVQRSYKRGPVLGKSVFGWVSSDNLLLAWSGLANGLLTPGLPYYYSTDHARMVAELIYERNSTPVIPIGVNECIQNPELWTQNVQSAGAKVVNLSSVFSYDTASCQESAIGKTISASPFLWVVGAGNDGEKTDLETSRSCPSNLGPRENMIVVASSPGESLYISSESTYGDKFADLVADGTHPRHRDSKPATSFAAPHVSSVAAQLAQNFPSLSVPELRMALLSSVQIPESWRGKLQPAEVRSGGFLDAHRAEAAAALLVSHSSWVHSVSSESDLIEMKKYFADLFCESDRSFKCIRKTEERIQLLIQNGVINNAYCP